MTITHDQLMAFCDKTGKNKILAPFSCGVYTYASNGKIAVRVTSLSGYADNISYGAILDGQFPRFDKIPADKWIDLPAIDSPTTDCQCPDCNGSGKSISCPDCGGNGEIYWQSEHGYDYDAGCRMCNGTGKIKSEKAEPCETCNGTGKKSVDRHIDVGSKLLSATLLKIMADNLQNVKIAPDAVAELAAVPFKFDGGYGIIMPLRKQRPL